MCKCKSCTLTQDLHDIYTTIDTIDVYMDNTDINTQFSSWMFWRQKLMIKLVVDSAIGFSQPSFEHFLRNIFCNHRQTHNRSIRYFRKTRAKVLFA
jgi:hypothetical protein